MLPGAYATPAAVIFVIGGLLACFAGYRLFRVVLGVYGFMFGAATVTTLMGGEASTFSLAVAAVVGGICGALLMIAAYFVGVGLIGAGLALLALNTGWQFIRHTDPPVLVVVIVAVLGALAALSIVRYVVVFGTALAGSWTAILGAMALMGDRAAAHAASATDVWVIYPLAPLTPWWRPVLWLALALAGVLVQLSTTTKTAGAKKPAKKK
jgi:hypothetical protein